MSDIIQRIFIFNPIQYEKAIFFKVFIHVFCLIFTHGI